MTDIEIIGLCVEGAEIPAYPWPKDGGSPTCYVLRGSDEVYDPFHDDAQAMALVKMFCLAVWGCGESASEWKWHAEPYHDEKPWTLGHGGTLNRAICECVAKMQQHKLERQ